MNPRDRFNNDPEYNALVNFMLSFIHDCKYTPSELREASILASIIYQEQLVRKNVCVDLGIENHLKSIDEWLNRV